MKPAQKKRACAIAQRRAQVTRSPRKQKNEPQTDYTKTLPDELLTLAFGHLSLKDRGSVSLVCKRWSKCVRQTPFHGELTCSFTPGTVKEKIAGFSKWANSVTVMSLVIGEGVDKDIVGAHRHINSALASASLLHTLLVEWRGKSSTTGLSFLRNLSHIRCLKLSGVPGKGAHLETLAGCKNIEKVDILSHETNSQVKLTGLKSLHKLKEFRWQGVRVPHKDFLKPLAKCRMLEKIMFAAGQCNHHYHFLFHLDIVCLSGLPLHTLYVCGARVLGLSELASSSTGNMLQTVALCKSGLVNADLADVGRLKNVVSLTLTNNGSITDITPLGHLKKVKNVSLSNTQVDSVEGLAGCENLETLDVQDSHVRDVGPVSGCVRLSVVMIDRGTNVEGLSERVEVCYPPDPLDDMLFPFMMMNSAMSFNLIPFLIWGGLYGGMMDSSDGEDSTLGFDESDEDVWGSDSEGEV